MAIAVPVAPERTTTRTKEMQILFLGVAMALAAQYAVQWIGHTPWWQRISRRFIWWRPDAPAHSPYGSYAGERCATFVVLGKICLPALHVVFLTSMFQIVGDRL